MKECKEENKLHIEKEEFSKSWEVMCNEAIEDIPNLTKHIQIYMGEAN